ncbi:MAG TPA: hypothetical protein VGF40_01325, partial [Thermoanaerobaculia bacterium]
MRTRVLLFPLALLLLSIGCASSGSTVAVQPVAATLGPEYKTVVVSVITSVPDSNSDALALENEIITELRK